MNAVTGMTKVINLNTVNDLQAWLKHPDHIYIGRGSKWGNSNKISKINSREQVVQQYFIDLQNNKELLGSILELQGKTLGCWCSPRLCHGFVLLEFLASAMSATEEMSNISDAIKGLQETFKQDMANIKSEIKAEIASYSFQINESISNMRQVIIDNLVRENRELSKAVKMLHERVVKTERQVNTTEQNNRKNNFSVKYQQVR